ncbi:MAG: RNA-binding S4 domain-containing protein [Bacteroidales bacterium]|jgi:ribosome-associated heat shock protein Hsp15|nr:RNA-binding S4 domain-containing protein [Bacteroidales bacterium]MBR3028391.1 RNA-binding S4 domain-containing protein [Bacteroidales bacterium]MBR3540437.1 RNA-binding S4 domain-containing protein [Bacteroidales bacterium]
MASNEVRIDKWLWAVRIFKTRTIASDAIKMGRVTIGGQKVKPSRNVKVGEVIDVKKPPITYSFKVLALAENRMGAKLVPGFMENVTRKEQLDLLEMNRISGFRDRAKGLGRPTKKDRRDIDDFTTPQYVDEFDFSLEDLEELDADDWAEIMNPEG